MTRRWICWMLAAAMLLCAGCGSRKEPAVDTPEQTAPTETPAETVPEPTAEPESAPEAANESKDLDRYAQVLDAACDVIYNGVSDGEEYPLVPSGVVQATFWSDGTETAEEIGFAFLDLNGDGENELLIGEPEDGIIYGGFSIVDGEPVSFLDGWYRSAFYLLDDGRFLYEGSGGAAYHMTAVYHLSEDGAELVCEDCWFTDVKEGTEDEIVFYHNTTGEWEKEVSELLDTDEETFWKQIGEQFEGRMADPGMKPLSAYEFAGPFNQPLDCKVRLDYEEDVSWQLDNAKSIGDDFPELAPTGDEYEVSVVFRAREDVTDFKLLSLSLTDVDAAGNPVYEVTELCVLPELKAGVPLTVPMTFPGDMPTVGFSYRENGADRQFSVSQSGRDGALVVVPIA